MSAVTIENNYKYQAIGSQEIEMAKANPIANIMHEVIAAKEENIKTSLSKKWIVYDPSLWGGDLTTMAYLGFEGVVTSSSKLQALGGMIIAGTVLGMIGGIANILVAGSTARELANALKSKKDMKLIVRLCFDCIFLFSIGVVMILASLAQMVSIGGLGAFLIANPWVLPVLFFIITLPLIFELLARIAPIALGKDFASKFKLDDLQKNLAENNWDKISEFFSQNHPFQLKQTESDGALKKHLIDKMEDFQAEIGTKAALSAHKLMMHLKAKHAKEALEQLEDLEKEIAAWNHSLYVRMGQQILYVLSFGLSMAALPLKATGAILNCADNWAMGAANAIPLYMDLFWPLTRNTPIVVPPVSEDQLANAV